MITAALQSLYPTAKWSVDGNTYADIIWVDEEQSKPTKAEIDSEIIRLNAQYVRNEYQRLRVAEYPSLTDQLDMQYHDSVNGTTTWLDAINAVKAKYPKP
jgi:hypothetical protein